MILLLVKFAVVPSKGLQVSKRVSDRAGVIKQILAQLKRKAESIEFNPLPDRRAPPQEDLFG